PQCFAARETMIDSDLESVETIEIFTRPAVDRRAIPDANRSHCPARRHADPVVRHRTSNSKDFSLSRRRQKRALRCAPGIRLAHGVAGVARLVFVTLTAHQVGRSRTLRTQSDGPIPQGSTRNKATAIAATILVPLLLLPHGMVSIRVHAPRQKP